MKKAPGVFTRTPGRGVDTNENHRFSNVRLELNYDLFDQVEESERPLLKTEFFRDSSRTIMTENDSPDLCFRNSINFYRGCEHGCVYCYARPTHEYLNLSAGLDFESKIFVKENAPALLREKFLSAKWVPEVVMMSGVTDCYQPAERQFKLARQCLEVFNEFKNPVYIITKNALITRDLDLLTELAAAKSTQVTISVTTLDQKLSQIMEPRASVPQARLQAIETLAKAGIPVSVNIAPVIPGLTDHEIPQILKASAEAGATSAGYVVVRLPHSVKELWSEWLENHFPDRKEKILNFLKDLRGDKLYDSRFFSRMNGEGQLAENIKNIFNLFRKKYYLDNSDSELSTEFFKRPGEQLSLL